MKFTSKFALSALCCLLLGNAHADSAYQWGPWMAQEDIERAILAGADPTELTDPTAAGPASPALPQLIVATNVELPRPDVPKISDGPIFANLAWAGSANMLLSMKYTASGTGDVKTVSGISPTYSYAGSNALLESGNHVWNVSVSAPVAGDYKFIIENQLDRPRNKITVTTLKLGDSLATLQTAPKQVYTDSLKVGQTATHSVTLNGSGVPTYSK